MCAGHVSENFLHVWLVRKRHQDFTLALEKKKTILGVSNVINQCSGGWTLSCVNTFFCALKFARALATYTWVKTFYTCGWEGSDNRTLRLYWRKRKQFLVYQTLLTNSVGAELFSCFNTFFCATKFVCVPATWGENFLHVRLVGKRHQDFTLVLEKKKTVLIKNRSMFGRIRNIVRKQAGG